MFYVRDRETGTVIERCDSHSEAMWTVEEFEHQDKINGEYTEDFYEIVPTEEYTYEPIGTATVNIYPVYGDYTLEVSKRAVRGVPTFFARLVKEHYGLIADCTSMPAYMTGLKGKYGEISETITEAEFVAMVMNQIDSEIECFEEDIQCLEEREVQ